MHLSRIDDLLKKFNNDKGDVQLKNHTNSLHMLSRDWVNDFVSDQYYVIDLMNLQGDKSFTKKSKDAIAQAREFNHILSRSMLIKLNKYLNDNQRFKVDKSDEKITSQLILCKESSNAWVKGWYAKISAREFCHQLCSIAFRARNGSCYSE